MSINLYAADLAFLFDSVNAPSEVRNVSGFGNNLANPLWGNADQPFVRLAPDAYAGVNSPRGVIVDGDGRPVDGDAGTPGVQMIQTLPNERLISDVLSNQPQPLDENGNPTDSMPTPFGTNTTLMLFGQFFDHGLDFIQRGGGTYTIDLSQLPPDIAADDVIIANLPPGFPPALFQGRGARYTDNGDGTYTLDNTDGTLHINKTSPYVDQNQTYGSTDAVTYLLRESIFDGDGNVVGKSERLLDGAADASGRGTAPRYSDILLNNGLSHADLTTALDMASSGSDYDAWLFLKSRAGFVDFGDVGDANHTPLLGDKNDFNASPVDQTGGPNANFSLSELLNYYIAGDHRVNENVGLTAIHTVWHREHNYQAERIAAANPGWTDDQVFQAAKIIVEAEYQRVVFEEFQTAMAGEVSNEHGFSGYDPSVNATISEEFASGMYRVGHSMINETLSYVDTTGERHEVSLVQAFVNPGLFASDLGGSGSAASLILGSTQVAHQEIDELLVVNAVRNMLLGQPLDLDALNISRGRETGLPSLNELRATIHDGTLLDLAGQASDYRATTAADNGLTVSAYTGWTDFGAHLRDPSLLADFIALYGIDPTLAAETTYAGKLAAATALLGDAAFMNSTETGLNNVDLFIGGLAEARFGGSQMGSTFTWVFQEQLDRLQDGDRLYYIERLDGTTLLEDIEAQTFADIIARNTGLDHLHDNIFAVAHEVGLTDDGNSDGNADTADFSGVSSAATDVDKLIVVGNDNANSIVGSSGDDTIYGEGGDDTIIGGQGKDGLRGGDGNDYLDGGAGDDRAFGDGGDDTLIGGQRKDKLFGGDGNDVLDGGVDDDQLFGGAGDDRLIGGAGKDHLDGGDGVDTADYSGSSAGVTVTLDFSVDGVGGDAREDHLVNIENVIGSNFADRLIGDGGANLLKGGAGDDTLTGGGGDDTLDGGTGADMMSGGAGNDVYVVDVAGDVVSEISAAVSGGVDTVLSSISYTAGANVENVTLTGSSNINATGNSLGNILTGNVGNNILSGLGGNDQLYGGGGNDTLDGNAGADVMAGNAGNDKYYVDNAGDVVNEVAGEGSEIVYTSVNYTLAAGTNVEALRALAGFGGLTLGGNEIANTIWGESGNDHLNGGGGNDILDGKAGADVMAGNAGNDRYYVDNAGDVVSEVVGEGADTLYASVDYTLAAGTNVESLRALAGFGGLTLGGNEIANTIWGESGDDHLNGGGGNDILDGKAGADVMTGNAGNDRYYVDNAGDVVSEVVGEGADTLYASVDYTLAAGTNVESLRALAGFGGLTLGGNEIANTIWGESGDDHLNGGGGNDILDGKAGADVMTGNAGNDRYYVDNAGDVVSEVVGEGADTLYASVDYTLAAGTNVESLRVNSTAISAIALTGNEFAQQIFGAAGNNTLDGAGGRDVLSGGGGDDTFVFKHVADTGATIATADRITDFTSGDLIDLTGMEADTGISFNFVEGAPFSNQAGEVRQFASGATTMLAGDVNGDSVADFEIALTGTLTLHTSDFIL